MGSSNKYRIHETVLAIGDRAFIKNAYFYFDWVIPVTLPNVLINFWPPYSDRIGYFISNILEVQKNWLEENEFEYMNGPPHHYDSKNDEAYRQFERESDIVHKRFLKEFFNTKSDLYKRLLSSYKLPGMQKLTKNIPLVLQSNRPSRNKSLLDIQVTMSNIPVVDVSNISDGQIMEFKRDNERAAAVRKFRMALLTNYQNKSKDYIHDHLSSLLYDYERSCRYHGIKLRNGVIKNVMSSKNLMASGTIALASIMFGEPLAALLSMSTGASIEIGKIALDLSTNSNELEYSRETNDFVYLFDMNEASKN